jgi:hypothetical protein
MVEVEPRQHAGADERGLAASGRAMDHDEMLLGKASDYLLSHQFAAEEDCPLRGLKRTQAGVRFGRKFV